MLAPSSDKIYNKKKLTWKIALPSIFLHFLELIFSTVTPSSSVLSLTSHTIPDPNYPVNHNHSLPVLLVCQDTVTTSSDGYELRVWIESLLQHFKDDHIRWSPRESIKIAWKTQTNHTAYSMTYNEHLKS